MLHLAGQGLTGSHHAPTSIDRGTSRFETKTSRLHGEAKGTHVPVQGEGDSRNDVFDDWLVFMFSCHDSIFLGPNPLGEICPGG